MKRIIGGLVGGGIAIFGGAQALDDDTKRDETGSIVEAGGLGVMAINVGDCIQLPSAATQVQSVEGVPCADPHDGQVFAEFDLAGGDFPGDAAVERQAGEGCLARWQGAIGTVYEQDMELDLSFFNPTAEGWAQGDHEVQCIVVRIDGSPLVGDRVTG